jgi:NADH-quinone oxidoreductase subunit F
LRAVIDAVGSGLAGGRTIKAVFSGAANRVLTADDLDAPLSYEGLAAVGSGMGAAGFVVYDDTACMVGAAYRLSRFLSVESCGQCPPCKLGSGAITEALERIEIGRGEESDITTIQRWLGRVTDGNRCYLPVQEQLVVGSVLAAFPEEIVDHIESRRCPLPDRRPIPKLVDLDGGEAVYDETFWRKRSDWSYEPEDS